MKNLPHNRQNFFSTPRYWHAVENFFRAELINDGEDITAEFSVPKKKISTAHIIVKSNGILAGKEELEFFLKKFFPEIKYTWYAEEGEKIFDQQKIFSCTGNAHKILKLERVFLNTLSRMSGIATMTHKISQLAQPISIAATRKTQWSYLDKKAVHIGGGFTHRMGLFDAILIKENHQIITHYDENIFLYQRLQKLSNEEKFFEIEVETSEEFEKIFTTFCDEKIFPQKLPKVIMLDNFSPKKIIETLKNFSLKEERQKKNIFFEASGGITEKNITEYAHTGVDVISLGALTHSVLPLDFSLRIEK